MASSSTFSQSLKSNAPKMRSLSSPRNNPFHANLHFLFSMPATQLKTCIKSSSTAKYNEVVVDEEMDKIRRLQNGSDVRGVAVEGEKGRTVDLTPPAVEAIAESFGEWVINGLEKEGGRPVEADVKVSLGRDPRISGASLSVGVFAGLARAGCMVFDMGLATTPACFMSTLLPPFLYDASIMMTASHLPYTRNGLKFFTKKGGLTSPEVEEICDRAARKYANRLAKVSTMLPSPKRVDFMSSYAKHLRDIIKERVNHPLHFDTPLQGFQIIVNAGNGSGGFFTWDVLDKLGTDTFGSLNLTPDGMFPNHIPNPEDKIAMALTRAAVLENSADLGIVFDTDVDRSGVVDSAGNPINGDKLIALMAAIVLKEHPGTTIVTDARTSMALTRFITDRGGHHCLYRVGYRNVIDKGVQLNDQDGIETHLMMETSGHGALKENHFLDDGAYMVVKIIIEMVRMKLAGSSEGIGSLIKDLEEPLESIELRMNIISEPRHAKAKGAEAIETFRNYIQEGRLQGWELDSCGDCWVSEGCLVDSNDTPAAIDAHMYRAKVSDEENGEHGWVHIRQSIHNPNIAINMQSTVAGGCQSMTRVLREKFLIESGMDRVLDTTQVEKYATSGNV
ncbi:hypothetical protein F0562_032625 [Nyssa sinensis]|uniref:phosphoglucomutase (alpha-D-glucose-1,6-bisphosphate-dependent) n=1 Tax=Nyssa sinensis TaxID=561372 RepID=A0A5J5AQL5_9ASTE|nr:hypothetical protein F0562_032625 [Nyssa sinensis]